MGGEEERRYAVVTGGNKGLGYGICRKLASRGITVMLTARNEKRGLEAVERLIKECGVSYDFVVFHQLDVNDSASVASLAYFVKTHFGRLDILVNNAGVAGGKVLDPQAFIRKRNGEDINWNEVGNENYEIGFECVETNFYGTHRTTEALLPLLHLSSSPRIINVSSQVGMLKNIQNEWARGVLSDIENLKKEKLDEVLRDFLKDFKEGSLKINGWPTYGSAYHVSMAAVNAYTRWLAMKFPNIQVNCVCPGFLKTNMNNNTGILSVNEGAKTPVSLALLPHGSPSGLFFTKHGVSPF